MSDDDDAGPAGPPHEARERLAEARAAAEDVLALTAGLDEAGFVALPDADRRTFRALKNALVEIGQAANGLPPDLRARHPDVDWRGWAGLCAVVSHRHFGPELPRLQSVVTDDLPVLLAALEAELAPDGTGGVDGQAPGAAE